MASRENSVVRLLENTQTKAIAPSFFPLPFPLLPPIQGWQADTCYCRGRGRGRDGMCSEKCQKAAKKNKKTEKEKERDGSSEHTYLHMDHTSQGETKSQRLPLFFAPLWSKSNNTPSPSSKHSSVLGQTQQAIERQKERHRERETTSVTWADCNSAPLSLSLSLCVSMSMSLSLSLLGGHETHTQTHTHTHTHTRCSLRHKGPHGNGAFRSPVALFMQRCITMGPPTGQPCQKSPPLASHSLPLSLHLSLSLSLSLSFSLTRPSAPPSLPPSLPPSTPSSPQPPSLKSKGGFWEEAGETEDGREARWREAHALKAVDSYLHTNTHMPTHTHTHVGHIHKSTHTHTHTHTLCVLPQWNSMGYVRSV